MWAVTWAVWAAKFSTGVASAALGHGQQGTFLPYVAGQLLACLVGVALCIGSERVLARVGSLSLRTSLVLMMTMSAIAATAWIASVRLGVAPLLRVTLAGERSALAADAIAPPGAATEAMFLFMAWCGAWFAVTYAEQLRESETRASEAQTRVIELEELLGSPRGSDEIKTVVLWVPKRGGRQRLEADEILYLAAEREYVRLYVLDRSEYLIRASLQQLHARLVGADFLQIHRSAGFNSRHVVGISKRSTRGIAVEMKGGSRLPVGRNFESAVRERLNLA